MVDTLTRFAGRQLLTKCDNSSLLVLFRPEVTLIRHIHRFDWGGIMVRMAAAL
jgi:hypothetical protein